jgi:hypothetical protein
VVAASIAQGCQTYPADFTGGGSPTLVNHGTLQVPAKAPLAIGLDYRALVKSEDCYGILQAVQHTVVEVGISGPGLANPITDTLTVSCNSGGTANYSVDHLPTGVPLTVSVTVKNGMEIVASAQQSVTLQKGTRGLVNLVCSTDTEGLDINFECNELCAPPPPANPNPATTISNITGITSDAAGNVYLFGLDPGVNSIPYPTPKHTWGRFIKVDGATHDVSPTIYADNTGAVVEAEVQGTTLRSIDGWRILSTDLQASPPVTTITDIAQHHPYPPAAGSALIALPA